ncbi:hypothetical protein Q8W71_02330 [Methylobacterium sp. NEAU 140]|uniref:hypothetical protein n=1 Tax=Methylobacterium sp. NEAU 140 TaxID=3064945 RepID=UPI002734471F|nr:hypothetical protein [Methylobacterium sp. NEAU 140]MDP4021446.1 hypothetical protein [Methylobacterium sp. NEAU 140]
MMKSDLQPPRNGLNADPILYGVAAGLAELFPPVPAPRTGRSEGGADTERDEGESADAD